MGFNFKYNFIATDKFSAVIRKIGRSLNSLKAKFKSVAKKARELGKSLNNIGKGMMLKVTAPLLLLGGAAIRATAKIESLEISFRTTLKSAEKAKDLMGRLKKFTATTPFQLEQVASATRQLLGASVPLEQIIPRLRMMGDVAAGAAIPLNDMVRIFSKSKQKTKAMSEEILQMAERGIPIIETLSKGLKINTDVVFEMATKGKLSFAIIDKAFKKLTTGTGMYAGATEALAKSLGGLYSTFKDSIFFILEAIGDLMVKTFGISENFSKLIKRLTVVPEEIREWGRANPLLAKTALILAGILTIMGPLLIGLGLMVHSFALIGVAAAAIWGPVTLIVAAVTGLVILGVKVYNSWKPFRDLVDDTWQTLKEMWEIGSKIRGAIAGGIRKIFGGGDKGETEMIKKNIQLEGGIVARQSVSQQIRQRADIRMSIRDPMKTVKSINYDQEGFNSFNIGRNLGYGSQ